MAQVHALNTNSNNNNSPIMSSDSEFTSSHTTGNSSNSNHHSNDSLFPTYFGARLTSQSIDNISAMNNITDRSNMSNFSSFPLNPSLLKPEIEEHIAVNILYNGMKEAWDCGLCRKSFKEKNDLYQHLRSGTHQAKKFGCNDCGKHFASMGALAQHLEQSGHSYGKGVIVPGEEMNQVRSLLTGGGGGGANISGFGSSVQSNNNGNMMRGQFSPGQFSPSAPSPMMSQMQMQFHPQMQPPAYQRQQSNDQQYRPSTMQQAPPMQQQRQDMTYGMTPNGNNMSSFAQRRQFDSPPPQQQQQQQQQQRYPPASYTPNTPSFRQVPAQPPKEFILCFSGVSAPRSLQGACSWILRDSSGVIVEGTKMVEQSYVESILPEYEGLYAGLQEALSRGIRRLRVVSDSELVFMHLNSSGNTCGSNSGLSLYQSIYRTADDVSKEVRRCCQRVQEINFQLVTREQNRAARELAYKALSVPPVYQFSAPHSYDTNELNGGSDM